MVEKDSLATLRAHSARSFLHRNLDSILQFIGTTNGDDLTGFHTLDGWHDAAELLLHDLNLSQWVAESSKKSAPCLSWFSGREGHTGDLRNKGNTSAMLAERRQCSWTEGIPASLHTAIVTQRGSQLCD